MSLVAEMKGYAKLIQAEVVANALHKAVVESFVDSGRAAANWNLSFGTAPIAGGWEPKYYGESGESYGSIGFRTRRVKDADKANANSESRKKSIASAKGSFYGYSIKGNNASTIDGGYIHEALGIKFNEKGNPVYFRKGAFSTVFLYNPIISTEAYAENANLINSIEQIDLTSITNGIKRRVAR